MKMTFTVWVYWQWARLKYAALELTLVRDAAEYLAYLVNEIRNPDKDFVPELNLPAPAVSLDGQRHRPGHVHGKRRR